MLPCAAYLRIYEPLSAFAADERARWSNYAASSDRPRRADRKSTRLNSSHLVISYAVFCLKKKNKCAEGITSCESTSRGRDHRVHRNQVKFVLLVFGCSALHTPTSYRYDKEGALRCAAAHH